MPTYGNTPSIEVEINAGDVTSVEQGDIELPTFSAAVDEFEVSTTDLEDAIIDSFAADASQYAANTNSASERISTRLLLRTHQQMPDQPLGTWLFNRYSEQYGIEDAAELLADGNSPSELMSALFERTIGEMTEEFSEINDEARAFNDVTTEWPHDIRARLAGYMLANQPSWVADNSTFRDELQRFAQTEDYHPEGDGPIPDQLQDGPGQLPENPFERDDYDDQMAAAYVVVWANGEDPEAIDFSEVEDLNDFRWWVEKTGDLDDSLRAHHFGRDVPIEVIRRAAAPEEWDELEPDLEENEHECASCMNVFYEIQAPDGSIQSVTASGESYDGRGQMLDDPNTPVYPVAPEEDGYICPSCYELTTEDDVDTAILGVDTNGAVAGLVRGDGALVDIGQALDRDDLATVNDLDAYTQTALFNFSRTAGRVFEDFDGELIDAIELSHHHSQSAGDAVWHTFEQNFANNLGDFSDVVSGPAIVRPRFENYELTIWAPSTRPEVVMEAKSFLKEPETHV